MLNHLVAWSKFAFYFYQAAHVRSSANIDPLGTAVFTADHEYSFGRRNNACRRYKHGWPRAFNRPKNGRVHAGCEKSLRVRHIEFHRHCSCFHVERVSRPRDHARESMIRIGRHFEIDAAPFYKTSDVRLRNRYGETQVRDLLEFQKRYVGTRPDQ